MTAICAGIIGVLGVMYYAFAFFGVTEAILTSGIVLSLAGKVLRGGRR